VNKKFRKPAAGFVNQLLRDPEVRVHFEVERARTELAAAVRAARQRAGLTQAELAKKIRTSQSVIARIESGTDQRTPSLPMLAKIAEACRGHLEVRFTFPKAA